MVCHARVWIGTPTTFQLVSRGNAAVQFIGATQWKKSYMLAYSWVHGPMIAGQPIIFLPWMVWHNCISSNRRSCKTVNPLISAILSLVDLRERHLEYWTPYSETHPRKHNSKHSSYLSPRMVCSSYKKGSSHSFALHPSQIHVSQPASWWHP